MKLIVLIKILVNFSLKIIKNKAGKNTNKCKKTSLMNNYSGQLDMFYRSILTHMLILYKGNKEKDKEIYHQK